MVGGVSDIRLPADQRATRRSVPAWSDRWVDLARPAVAQPLVDLLQMRAHEFLLGLGDPRTARLASVVPRGVVDLWRGPPASTLHRRWCECSRQRGSGCGAWRSAPPDVAEVGRTRGRIGRSVWRPEIQPAVWALGVVVSHVLVEHPLQVPSTQDERPVQTLLPDGPHPALSEAVRPWGSERVRTTWAPSAVNTASKLLVYLESRSRIRNRNDPRSAR